MISVLVPIFNYDVVEFVTHLHTLCKKTNLPFEILCYDDCSDQKFKNLNKQIQELNQVKYKELEFNHGRSKIRNLLANEALCQKLLFVDCDSKIPNDNYISNYLKASDDSKVIYGGRSYSKERPENTNEVLRWKYGLTREVKSSKERNTEPYRNFMTNNFLIDKELAVSLPFNENLIGYGYEDLDFALSLKNNSIQISHIDNPLIHQGLEPADVFLEKTANGMINLSKMINENKIDNSIRIYRVYKKLRSFGIVWVAQLTYFLFKKRITRNLLSSDPNLNYFDLFKLIQLSRAIRSK